MPDKQKRSSFKDLEVVVRLSNDKEFCDAVFDNFLDDFIDFTEKKPQK